MSEEKKSNKVLEKVLEIVTMENIQKYVLGTKKSGSPRAVYDIIRDYSRPKKRKKYKGDGNSYSLYLRAKKNKKKKDKSWKF